THTNSTEGFESVMSRPSLQRSQFNNTTDPPNSPARIAPARFAAPRTRSAYREGAKTIDRVALVAAAFALGAASRTRPGPRAEPAPVALIPDPEDLRPPRWLASAARRNWLATAASLVPLGVFIAAVVGDVERGTDPQRALPLVMIIWGSFSLVHSGSRSRHS